MTIFNLLNNLSNDEFFEWDTFYDIFNKPQL